jgi:hypothetical protein
VIHATILRTDKDTDQVAEMLIPQFLNMWKYYLGENLLVATGAAQDYTSGTQFWNIRGRLLYNATIGQPFYNSSFVNGTTRPKPLLRTTSQERILDSALAWANGK